MRLRKEIQYSAKYSDDKYEYRHVILSKLAYDEMPKARLLVENEWRSLGVLQSQRWEHYMIHQPEPYVLLFRRASSKKLAIAAVSESMMNQEVISISS